MVTPKIFSLQVVLLPLKSREVLNLSYKIHVAWQVFLHLGLTILDVILQSLTKWMCLYIRTLPLACVQSESHVRLCQLELRLQGLC